MARIQNYGRKRFEPRFVCVALLASFAASALAETVLAEGFRIETKIYVDGDDEPASTTTTLFVDGVFYDYLDEPEQIAVFRKPGNGKPGRFILLDPQRKVRTELTTDQLAGAMQKLRSWAGRQKDPFLKFAARPDFDESFDKNTGQLILASHIESYTIQTSPAGDPEGLSEYRSFLDWYAQLNALMHAGPPPEPRLQVNAALERLQRVPDKVELTRSGEKKPLRAEHTFTWRLSKADFERIDGTNASLAAYEPVDNAEFLQDASHGHSRSDTEK